MKTAVGKLLFSVYVSNNVVRPYEAVFLLPASIASIAS